MKKAIIVIVMIMAAGFLSAQGFEPVPFDKKYHMGAGAVAGAWGTFAGNSCNLTPEQSALCGIAAATAAGIGKELMDVTDGMISGQQHNFDAMDVAATIGGGIIGTGLSYVALKLFKRPPVIYSMASQKSIQVGLRLTIVPQ